MPDQPPECPIECPNTYSVCQRCDRPLSATKRKLGYQQPNYESIG
ncbi:MAG TPA: hypothetical protein V6D10_19080 [Trichocoleus sp.]